MMVRMFCTAVLAALLTTGSAIANEQLDDPSALFRDKSTAIVNKLNERRAEIRANPRIAEEIVRSDLLPLMDIEYSARLILGREARSATPEQLDAFAIAMSNQLINRFASGLLHFRSREQVQVLDLKGKINARATKVKTRWRLDSGGYALVDYVVRMTDDGWKVFDVVVEGISYIISFQGQIRPEVRAIGLDAVTERLSSGDLDLAD